MPITLNPKLLKVLVSINSFSSQKNEIVPDIYGYEVFTD